MCVEFFIDKKDNLYVNEIAPRVHNSGHLTINSHIIKENPKIFPIIHKKIRRALIHRFPYGIFYFTGNDLIIVSAIFHAKREPQKWERRFEEERLLEEKREDLKAEKIARKHRRRSSCWKQ